MNYSVYGEDRYSSPLDVYARKHLGVSGSFTNYLRTGDYGTDEFVSSKRKNKNTKKEKQSKLSKFFSSQEGKNAILGFAGVVGVVLCCKKIKKSVLGLFKK